VAGRFLAWARRDDAHTRPAAAGRLRSNAAQAKKRRHPEGESTFGTFGGVAHSLSGSCRTGMRVARALPSAPNCSCAASSYPIYEMASKLMLLPDE